MNTATIGAGDRVKFYTDLWCDGKWIVGNVVHTRWTASGQFAEIEGRDGKEYQIPVHQLEKTK